MRSRRRLLLAVALLAMTGIALVLPNAAGAKPIKAYPLAGAKSCRSGFVRASHVRRVRGHRERVLECVAQRGIRLDPSFTQNPKNPLDVTYSFSAAAYGFDVSAVALPRGVLRFTSENSSGWEHTCVVNVGGSRGEGTCELTIPLQGTYTNIVEYDSRTVVTSQTTEDTINPYTTTTTLDFQTPISVSMANCTQSDQSLSAIPTACEGTIGATVKDENGNVLPSPRLTYQVGPAGNNSNGHFTGPASCTLAWFNQPASFSQRNLVGSSTLAGSTCSGIVMIPGPAAGKTFVESVSATFSAQPGYLGSSDTSGQLTLVET